MKSRISFRAQGHKIEVEEDRGMFFARSEAFPEMLMAEKSIDDIRNKVDKTMRLIRKRRSEE